MGRLVVVRSDARAEALLRWASCFADGNFEELYVLDCRESEHEITAEWKCLEDDEFPEVSYKSTLRELDGQERMKIQRALRDLERERARLEHDARSKDEMQKWIESRRAARKVKKKDK